MKVPYTLTSLAFLALPSLLNGQSLVSSSAFFNPDVRAQHAFNAGGLLAIDTTPVANGGSSGGSPNVTWSHNAGGYVGLDIGLANVHLTSFTETTGDSLVFGRQLATGGLLGALGPVLSDVLGVSALTTWNSSALVSGINIAANQLYQVSFNITAGSALPVSLLSDLEFGIGTAGILDSAGNQFTTLDALGLIVVAGQTNLQNGVATFTFQSNTARSDIQFDFGATSTVGLGLLGGTAGNSNVLTFSNFSVVPVPEPSVSLLGVTFAGLMLARRRRVA